MINLSPPVIFEDLFERDGKWLLGPSILASVVRYMKGKAIVLIPNSEDMGRLDASLPELPKVRNEIDGSLVSIYWVIPEELRSIFDACCSQALAHRRGDIELIWPSLDGAPNTQVTRHRANQMLATYELNRMQRADLADPELWQILAEQFGLDWRFLPPDAFV